jgi:hypothetical protein
MKNNASVTFSESAEPKLFAEYVELRRRVFHERYPNLSPDFGQPDDTDPVSHIVYAVQDNIVAGAARLTISTSEDPRQLPLEENSLRLREHPLLKHLLLATRPYAEISRMAVDPDCSDGLSISFGLGQQLCQVAAEHGVDLIFSICPPAAARLNRLNSRKVGVTYDIYMKIPTVFGIDMLLCAYSGILRAARNSPDGRAA